ncbi:hypothetical protein B0H19DRAFT_1247598 [Mycena capillaripes]|nr:hypothetical protein B0H19DRAFT_1247598 [Mycena capillaripes]
MGNTVSGTIKGIDGGEAKEKIATEQLELLMKLADARLDTFEEELNRMFLDKECNVPGKRALRFERSGAPTVGDAVDAFFGTSGKSDKKVLQDKGGPQDTTVPQDKSVLQGFKAVVEAGLKTILGDTSAGESYDKKFFVCIKHNAIIRVDVYTYRYNFHNEGLIATHKNLLAYILCVSVVDHTEVTPDEMVYLASEFAGDESEDFEAYLNKLMGVWNKLSIQNPNKRLI